MTSNLSPLQPLNAPPTIRDLNENQTFPLSTEPTNIENANFPLSLTENYAIQFELKNISREVSKIAEKQKYQGQRPQLNMTGPFFNSTFSLKELDNDLKNILNLNANGSQIGKYNYYGHQYRHENQKLEKNEQKLSNCEDAFENEDFKSSSPTKKNQEKKQELKIPDSESYYIYFDDPKTKSNLKELNEQSNETNDYEQKSDLTKNRIYFSQQLNEPPKYPQKQNSISFADDNDEARTPPVQVFSKQEPSSKWVLEKKVKKLEKELYSMKKKESQRERLKNFTYNQVKKDEKVSVGRQVDQLINSLWP